MKNNLLGRLIVVLIYISCIFGLTGCGDDNAYTSTSLVVIAGLHSNSQKMNISLLDEIKRIYSEFGNVSLIVADGSPSVVRNEDDNVVGVYNENYISYAKEIKKNNYDYWFTNFLTPQITAMNNKILSLSPEEPEVDTMAAIQEAEKSLREMASEPSDEKEIIIFDSGLCTCGALSFFNNNCYELLFNNTKIDENSVKNLIESLKANAEIPDLSGVKVTWYGLGNVANPQSKLSSLNIENLKTIWGEILKSANAIQSDNKNVDSEYGFFIPVIASKAMEYSQPVSIIIDWDNVGSTKNSNNNQFSQGIIFPEKQLGFIRNSVRFSSKEKALSILHPYAENLKNYPDMRVLLVGTTADPNRNGGSISLSKKRAKKVKQCLVSLGVSAERIDILGWGAKAPLYNKNEWENGNFIEEFAKTNRSVILLPCNSDLAKKLMGN